jgi:AcrR family transcriptional regulator
MQAYEVLTFLMVLGFPYEMSTTVPDRRTRRRQETIGEILDVAIELMKVEGVAALSLSAVARRLGMQPPSLYQYFPSKMAIYDALFQRGSELFLAAQREAVAAATTDDVVELHLIGTTALARWSMQNPVYSQLLFWRTVPGFEPSPEAFVPAQEALAELRRHLQAGVDAGRLHPDAASEEGLALFTSVTSGVLSQQMANEPDATFEEGRFSRLLPVVLEMFYQHYAPHRGKRRDGG